MDLSIVIVNWNTQDLLRDCLISVEQALAALQAQIIVVDNASDDASCKMVRCEFPAVQLIESKKNLGFAGGNNIALARTESKYVLLLNTDTLVHGQVLSEAINWLDQNPEVAILGPRVLNSDGTIQPSCSSFPSLKYLTMQTMGLTRFARWDSYRMTGWDRSSERHVDVISGAAMFVRKSAIDEVGLLDESFFFYGEETDWCRRFTAAGWGIVFAPIPDITHFGNGSAARLNHRRDVLMTEGTVRLHLKHGGVVAAFMCFLILCAHNLTRAIFWSVAGILRRPGARMRAIHFAKVVRDLPRAWPRVAERVSP